MQGSDTCVLQSLCCDLSGGCAGAGGPVAHPERAGGAEPHGRGAGPHAGAGLPGRRRGGGQPRAHRLPPVRSCSGAPALAASSPLGPVCEVGCTPGFVDAKGSVWGCLRFT